MEGDAVSLLASDEHGTRPLAAVGAYNDEPLDDKTALLRAQEAKT